LNSYLGVGFLGFCLKAIFLSESLGGFAKLVLLDLTYGINVTNYVRLGF